MNEIILRRDPRKERIARNRLHPEHGQENATQFGPTGLLRREVHGIGFIGPNGIKRIDRLNLNDAGSALSPSVRSTPSEPKRTPYIPETFEQPILVVLETASGKISDHGKDILGQAHHIAATSSPKKSVDLVLFGELIEGELSEMGVDRVMHVNDKAFSLYNPEVKVSLLQKQVERLKPQHILFAESDDGSGELGRRLSSLLNTRPNSHVFKWVDNRCHSLSARGTQQYTQHPSKVVLLLPECSEPVSDTQHVCEDIGMGNFIADPIAEVGIADKGAVEVDPSTISLGEAEFILSGGNGVKDWSLFKKLASQLGATMGASRVAVDDGFMPRSTQVGATGTWVTARVYIAVGISGAVQHLQGIEKCEKVIAINTDIGCDMIKRSELSVIADSTEIMQAMSVILEERSGINVAHKEKAKDTAYA